MPSITARSVIEPAFRLIGIAAAEQPLSAFDVQVGLDAFNGLIDSWTTENLLIYARPKLALSLVPGQQMYTWGVVEGETTPAAIPSPAPVRLDMCLLNIGGSPEQEWPLEVIDQAQYEGDILQKTFSSSYPWAVYLDPTRPYARLFVWPVPDFPYVLHLIPWPALPPYAHLDSSLDWPNGYMRAFQFNVAIDLAPSYGVEPSPTVMRIADESKRALYPINARVGSLALFPGRGVGGSGLGYPRSFYTGR